MKKLKIKRNNRVNLNVRVPNSILLTLLKLAKSKGITKTELVESILNHFLGNL